MKYRKLRIHFCALLLAGIAAPLLAAPPEAAKGCHDCHGDNGVSTKPEYPTIAGMSEFYLEGQMQAYQKDQRPCTRLKDDKTDMCEVAKKLSAAQVTEVATYFAGLKFAAAKQTVDSALAAKGKSLHAANCETCHTDGGSVPDDDAGILAGQWKPYLLTAMKEYHSGKRIEPKKMKPKTEPLSDDDVKALVEFYASEGAK